MVRILVGLLGLSCLIAFAIGWLMQPLPFPGKAQAGAAHADPAKLEAHVRQLSVTFAKRHFERPKVLQQTAGYIRQEFERVGARVRTQSYVVGGDDFVNVIARFGPEAGAPIVIGAHYDAEEHTPGADDNASGVAGLIELARILGQVQPTVPVELVAYTLEEPPIFGTDEMGSRQHAKSLADAGVAPRLAIALEMIGYFDDREGSQKYPSTLMKWLYPSRGDFIAVVGNLGGIGAVRAVKRAMSEATDLPVWSINAPAAIPGVDFSDHASYWQYGMPAVMVTDTAFYRNRHYHRPEDTYDRLDYRRMAKVVDGIFGVVRGLKNEV